MKRDWMKRTLCGLLAAVMLLGNAPVPVFAAAEDGLCQHHPAHTEDCGYADAVAGSPCTHEHTEDCYTAVTECVHTHGDCGYVPAVEGHSCDCQPDETGEIVHTEGCGYTEAVTEVPCGHVCSEETGCVTQVVNCRHTHDDTCGYAEAREEAPCGFVCAECTVADEQNPEEPEDPEEPEADPTVCTGKADCPAQVHDADCEKKLAEDKAAEEEVPQPEGDGTLPEMRTAISVWVNPLYAGQVDPTPSTIHSISRYAETEPYTSLSQISNDLREAMKQRVDSLTVSYQVAVEGYDTASFEESLRSALYQAMNHTGVPTEGDYLRGNFQKATFSHTYPEGDLSEYPENTFVSTVTYQLEYNTTADQEAEMDAAVRNLLATLNPTGTDYQKLCTIYDYITANVAYDNEHLNDDTYTLKFSAYAALVNKTAVCQGYATLLYRLALEMGIDARMITGRGGGDNHAWNILKLDGLYYNADATWDAGCDSDSYSYFLVSDANFADHTRESQFSTSQFYASYPMGSEDYSPSGDAPSGDTCGDNLTWALDDSGTLTISGSGAMYDFVGQAAPWTDQAADITTVVIGADVTEIGYAAFDSCTNLARVQFCSAEAPVIHSNLFLGTEVSMPILEFPEVNESWVNVLNAYQTLFEPRLTGTADYAETLKALAEAAYSENPSDEEGMWDVRVIQDTTIDGDLTPGSNVRLRVYGGFTLTVTGTLTVNSDLGFPYPYVSDASAVIRAGSIVLSNMNSLQNYTLEADSLTINATDRGYSTFYDCVITAGNLSLNAEIMLYENTVVSADCLNAAAASGIDLYGGRLDAASVNCGDDFQIAIYPNAYSGSDYQDAASANLTPYVWLSGLEVDTEEAFVNALSLPYGSVSMTVVADLTVNGSVTVPEKVQLCLRRDVTLTVNGVLTIDGNIRSYYDDANNCIQAQAIVMNGFPGLYDMDLTADSLTIHLEEGGYYHSIQNSGIQVGSLTVDTTYPMQEYSMSAGIILEEGADIRATNLTVQRFAELELNGGSLIVSGNATFDNGSAVIDLSGYADRDTALASLSENLYPYFSVYVTVSTEQEIKDALALPFGGVEIRNVGQVTLTEDLTIPEGCTYRDDYRDITPPELVVSEGCTLTNQGSMWLDGGTLTVQSGAALQNNGIIEAFSGDFLNAEAGSSIRHGENGELNLYWYSDKNLDTATAAQVQTLFDAGMMSAYILGAENFLIDRELVVPLGSYISFDNSNVTITEAGKLVVVDEMSAPQLLNGSTLTINGKYDGPPIFVENGSQVLPESKIAERYPVIDGDGEVIFIGTPKATSLTLAEAQLSEDGTISYVPITGPVEIDMAETPEFRIYALVEPEDASSRMDWTTSSAAVATVDSNGLVCFRKPGTVTITAKTKDGSGLKASVQFKVIYKYPETSFTAKLAQTSEKYDQPIGMGLQLGDRVAMHVYGADKTTALEPTDFDYTSNNACVSVDENGVITAVKSGGSAKITAALKDDPLKRKVTITVKTIPVQTAALAILPGEGSPGDFRGVTASGDLAGEDEAIVSYALLVDKIEKGQAAQSFTIRPVATDALGEPVEHLAGMITWASSASKIASVKEGDDGTVTVTIQPDMDGAVTITGTTKDLQKNQATLAVYVRDYTPRLEASSLTLDTQKKGYATIPLVESYGNEITGVTLRTYDTASKAYVDNDGSGCDFTTYYDYEYNSNNLTVSANRFLKNQTVKGQLVVQTRMGEYVLPLNLVIKNQIPKVTVKQSGSFNRFYLDSEVTLTIQVVGVDTGDIEDASFITGTFAGEDYVPGTFASEEYVPGSSKLTVVYDDLGAAYNAKGTLYLLVEGYAHPIEKAVTINASVKKPSLALKPASGVLNPVLDENATVLTSVYNNTAKAPLDMENVTATTDPTAIADVYVVEDVLKIAAKGSKGGNVVISLRDSNWLEPITLNYSLSINSKLPTVKPVSATLSLNSNYPGRSASTGVTLSQANLDPTKIEDAVLTPVKPNAQTEKLAVTFADGVITAEITDNTVANGSYSYSFVPVYGETALAKVTVTVKVVNTKPTVKLSKNTVTVHQLYTERTDSMTISLSDPNVELVGCYLIPRAAEGTDAFNQITKTAWSQEGNTLSFWVSSPTLMIKTGSYGGKLVAVCRDLSGDTEDLIECAPVNFTVRVINTMPTVKLSASTLSLNTVLAGQEETKLTSNTSTADYQVYSCDVECAETDAGKLAEADKISIEVVNNQVTASLISGDIKPGSYRFNLYSHVMDVQDSESGQIAKLLKPLSFTVKVFTNANYSATVSASGKLDAAARSTGGITYTLTKLNNVTGEVVNGRLEGPDKDLFELVNPSFNAKGQPMVTLRLKKDAEVSTKASYQVKLVGILDSGIEVPTANQTVKVTQSALKFTVSPKVQNAYQSQSKDREIYYEVELTSPAGTDIGSVAIGDVGLLQKALVNEADNIHFATFHNSLLVVVTLKDTSKLSVGKTYTLPLLLTAKGQATNVAPTKVNLSLKAMK